MSHDPNNPYGFLNNPNVIEIVLSEGVEAGVLAVKKSTFHAESHMNFALSQNPWLAKDFVQALIDPSLNNHDNALLWRFCAGMSLEHQIAAVGQHIDPVSPPEHLQQLIHLTDAFLVLFAEVNAPTKTALTRILDNMIHTLVAAKTFEASAVVMPVVRELRQQKEKGYSDFEFEGMPMVIYRNIHNMASSMSIECAQSKIDLMLEGMTTKEALSVIKAITLARPSPYYLASSVSHSFLMVWEKYLSRLTNKTCPEHQEEIEQMFEKLIVDHHLQNCVEDKQVRDADIMISHMKPSRLFWDALSPHWLEKLPKTLALRQRHVLKNELTDQSSVPKPPRRL